jgi:3-oxoacyl-[acyl-carrier protein] reductase
MFDLNGKTALVTGASGGIGREIACALHRAGATVAISGTRREALDELATELAERTLVLPCNLSDKEETEKLVPAAEVALGGLDILVNNAGVTRDGLFMRLSDDDWQEVLNVNLTSAFRLMRASLRGMIRKRFGRIIGVTSMVGVTGNPGQGNYAASKAGLIGMSKSLAYEVAGRGVTVNCVAPGMISSPMIDALTDAQRNAMMQKIPVGRIGAGAEVAAAVVFLASTEASYVTGHTLHVNGGLAMI